ncbi:hypothetical protein [Tengunoibacter tsumagoiensis]|uniref:LysM domain-containing protein n=1 Tax=Tengunoibacter tsumagoiensis TaxID=2014871 RepID=A0A401ZXM0_9CHLR|nr:hypothetical protein [Tengunoibacter tsumagoiensis]GCE11590.1 hypothetical protein KTT_14490 [Tengunoibacter tsumagoiensis]
MVRRFRPRSTPGENAQIMVRSLPWRLLLVLPVLIIVAIPTYVIAALLGGNVVPGMAQMFYKLSAPVPLTTPTPYPTFPTLLPQIGSVLYTVQDGDSCDSILAYEMHMNTSGQIFSDVKPETVAALNAQLGQNCGRLQPGLVLPLAPHYPLVAIGGIVLRIDPTSPQQVIPTPLITIPDQKQYAPNCEDGCLLTVRITPEIQIHLIVKSSLSIYPNSWVWALAQLARKPVHGFDTYPYADPKAALNTMKLSACDLQVDDVHDDDALSCSQMKPNTVNADGGSWLFAVTGPAGLDHWHYPINVPQGTRVLLWLSKGKNGLSYQKGDPAYRYDDATHVYVKI